MIGITLNGEQHKFNAGITITGLLQQFKLEPGRIVVQLNEEIINRGRYSSHQLKDGDCLELVKFMAGG